MHRYRVADHFACGVGGATGHGCVLGDVEARGLLHRDTRAVGIGPGLVGVGRRQVDDVAARIDLGLGNCVAGRVAPSLAYIEFTVRGRCAVHQGQIADEGVRDDDAGESLVAGVLHGDGVADHFTSGVGSATRNGGVLGDVEARGLLHWNGGTIGIGPGLVRISGRQVDDLAARINVGLGHHMGARPCPGFTHAQFAIA